MTDEEQKRIFVNNLRDALNRSGKQQIEVAKAIGVSQQTFNSWCRGIALPRIGKIEKLAHYFGITKGALIDPPSTAAVSPSPSPDLDPDDQELLSKYHMLSDEGKVMLQDRADELIALGKTVEEEAKKDRKVSG